MFRLMLVGLRRYWALAMLLLLQPRADGRKLTGAIGLVLLFPLALVVQSLHWFGFLLDEIFFRGYRQVRVTEPLFVLGPPRSGTTHVHHVLAQDPQTTTFRTWECLFGLSVTARYICLGLGRLDRALGKPVGRASAWIGRRLFAGMDGIHAFRLSDPEEDSLALMPIASCFLLAVPFPRADWLWAEARLDTAVPVANRQALMRFYRGCIQKHLYVFGENRRFLAKNPAFSGMAESLLQQFPDARILACMRDPVPTVSSQLSSIGPALSVFGFTELAPEVRDAFVELLHHYYVHLINVAEREPGRIALLANTRLRHELSTSVTEGLTKLGRPPGEALAKVLAKNDALSRSHKSSHRHDPAEFGLDRETLKMRFADVYDRYSF